MLGSCYFNVNALRDMFVMFRIFYSKLVYMPPTALIDTNLFSGAKNIFKNICNTMEDFKYHLRFFKYQQEGSIKYCSCFYKKLTPQ